MLTVYNSVIQTTVTSSNHKTVPNLPSTSVLHTPATAMGTEPLWSHTNSSLPAWFDAWLLNSGSVITLG
jgi:hypothetical protein